MKNLSSRNQLQHDLPFSGLVTQSPQFQLVRAV